METNKVLRGVVGSVGYILMLISLLMVIISAVEPILTTDYGHPTKLQWENDEKKKADIEYDKVNNSHHNLETLQREVLHLPFALNNFWFGFAGFVIGILSLMVFGKIYDFTRGVIDDNIRSTFYGMWAVGMIVTIIMTGVFLSQQSYGEVILTGISDRALADKVNTDFRVGIAVSFVVLNVGIFIGHYCLYIIFCYLRFEFPKQFLKLRNAVVLKYNTAVIRRFLSNDRSVTNRKLFDEYYAEALSKLRESRDIVNCDSIGNKIVQVTDHGVELIEYSYELSQGALPVIVLKKKIIGKISFEDFMSGCFTEIIGEFPQRFQDALRSIYKEKVEANRRSAISDFISSLSGEFSQTVNKKTARLKKNEFDKSRQEIIGLLTSVAIAALRKFKKELVRIDRVDIENVLENFKEKTSVAVLDKVQGVIGAYTDRPHYMQGDILPQNTKYYLKQGGLQAIVIEQPPMLRTIYTSRDLADTNRSHYTVAFPFVQFILGFADGDFTSMRVSYSTVSIQSIDDYVYQPNLTNIGNFDVCHGFPGHQSSRASFSEKVQEVISHFWNSEFNTDRSSTFESYRSRDKRLNGMSKWEAASKADNNFPLSVAWRDEKMLGTLIHDMLSGMSANPDEAIVTQINDAIINAFELGQPSLVEALMKRFSKMKVPTKFKKSVREKLESHESQFVDRLITEVLDSLTVAGGNKQRNTELLKFFYSSVDEAIDSHVHNTSKTLFVEKNLTPQNIVEIIEKQNRAEKK